MAQAINVDALRDKLRDLLLKKVESGKLVLPALPTTTAKVLECLDQEDLDIDQVGKLIGSDPVLSLDLLRLVNSSAFAPKSPIDNHHRAVSMLGTKRLRAFLVASSARQVFLSRIPEVRETFNQLWQHSVGVAALARQVAVHAGFEDRDAPYMAGLMHDVGKPIVAVHLFELEKSMARWQQSTWIDARSWLRIVNEIHRPVGTAVAKRWGLPTGVIEAIEDCIEYDPGDRLSPANAVRFANAVAKREGICVGDVDMGQVNTVIMIGRSILGLDENAVEGLAKALPEAVAEMS